MIFSSPLFLCIFLPLFLCVYYVSAARHRSLIILAGSYAFYAWWRVDFTLLFAGVTYATYLVSLKVHRFEGRARLWWVRAGVAGNLAVLGYFKYSDFGLHAWAELTGSTGRGWQVILPIGISFYVFHCISYLVDVYRRDASPPEHYTDFAAFTALFPHLIAGPVLRYKDLAWQFAHRTHTLAKFNEGCLRFALGFTKKILIADTLSPLADLAFATAHPTGAEAWLGLFAYTAQLYFDFSGYSDMAVGLALMMGFRFIENFNAPYTSRSITEFWRRWHISLSTWLRDYLYVPLGGNRKGRMRTYLNLFLTMLLGGLWHGAGWNFLFWGAWHGMFLALERLLGGKDREPYPRLVAWPLTTLLVMIGWVAFRAPTMGVALQFWHALFFDRHFFLSDTFVWQVDGMQLTALALAILWAGVLPHFRRRTLLGVTDWAARAGIFTQASVMALFLLAIIKMTSQSYSPFLYFQF